ncbi:MAG: histidine phosphatase family protein [Cyanobacteria bacterium]|nr:histidine phosphatase family protein [Cyanobacteriota bacterium]
MSKRQLVLIRHAKAASKELPMADFDRALTEFGRQQASLMGEHLSQKGFLPQMILCSSSLRTKQTWETLLEIFNASLQTQAFTPPLLLSDDLYLSSVSTYLQTLEILPSSIETVFLIGHNPEIEAMMDWSLEKRPDLFQDKFTTCAVAVIQFESDSWAIKAKSGQCLLATSPKQAGLRANKL